MNEHPPPVMPYVDDTAYLPIQEYAIIGNCGTAALVSRHGSIDWLCLPRFDGPSIFAALLDARCGGRFYVRPTAPYTVARHYIEDTNVLETVFTTDTGTLRLIDAMIVGDGALHKADLLPDHELIRGLHCTSGEVEVEVLMDPRFDYGRVQPRLTDRGKLGYFYNSHTQVLAFRSEIPLDLADDLGSLHGRAPLREGERRTLALTFDALEPAVLPLVGEPAWNKLDTSIRYWKAWASRCEYDGPFRDAVMRSALTLKLMTYSRSGAVVAAPTTSLPEAIGGERNWDYRYCWLRDASFTMRAMFGLGYREEGETFFSWLLHAVGGSQSDLHILYDVYGGTHINERTLDHLEGYKGSRPVRVGNGAQGQLQLDMYGQVISAAYEFVQRDGRFNRAQARILSRLSDFICERWHEPDNGIWEKRAARQHHTYSKVMCWVAMDRFIEMHETDHLNLPVDTLRRTRDAIREAVERHGYNDDLQSYTSTFDGDEVDASLLLLPDFGYIEADHPRMQSTFARIQERLAIDGLLYRYPHDTDDGFDSVEGTFGICSFWDEAYLALLGKVEEAKEHLRKTLSYANDLTLFAEQIDPHTGDALGNFPQAFTHIGLINAALTIARAEGDTKAPPLQTAPEERNGAAGRGSVWERERG